MAIRFSLGTVRIGTCCKGNGLPRQCAHWLAMTGGGTFPHSCHCEERSDVAIRFSLGTVRIGTCCKGKRIATPACALVRNDSGSRYPGGTIVR